MRLQPRLALSFVLICAFAQVEISAEDRKVDFAREILPILSDKCFVCHGPDAKDEDDLRLDSLAGAIADRGGYQAINPDAPKDSELLSRIHSTDDPMPPEDADKQLTDAERELLTKWVQQGGAYAKHWAFVPPKRKFSLSKIDDFVAQQFEAKQISFASPTAPETLARRVALVLTGLPPEPDQLKTFLADSSSAAYGNFVDMLLSSPRFGEHQARYWLDAVRYGDTHGLHLDNRRGIYPYRDWVVKAFNDNLPLDDFITWQLAGDLLPEPSMEQRVATGFVRMNPSTSEGGAIPAEFQAKNNFDRVETLGTVLLGMSLTCARCHTHKYDPITQTEYYRLMAFFNSTADGAMDGNKYEYGPTVKAPKDQAGWAAYQSHSRERDKLLQRVARLCVDEELTHSEAWQKASPNEKLTQLVDPSGSFAKAVNGQDSRLGSLFKEAQASLKQAEEIESSLTTTLVAKDLGKPRATHILRRGEYNLPVGEPVEPGILEVMGSFPAEAPRNRLGLAQWLTSQDHPLVARVLVNRVWQRVFGYGLVRSAEDFGVQGQQPTHPELLDWLAVELQNSGWDLKHLLRLMVTSKTFCQSSAWGQQLDDPENRLFARSTSYRMDAEVLRDLGLWSSRLLDPKMGGEGVKPYQPVGMWMAMAHPASNTKKYVRDKGELLYRRSLYVYWKRTSPHPMMTLFDAPDREASCVQRSRTNTSLQSLGLLNETQRIEMAKKLAERLLKDHDDTEQRLDFLYRLLTCRQPTNEELTACKELLSAMSKRYSQNVADAKKLIATGDAQCDESLDPSQLASWTQVCATVLASDAVIVLY